MSQPKPIAKLDGVCECTETSHDIYSPSTKLGEGNVFTGVF